MPVLLKLFQKIAEEGTLPNSFYKATISLIPKLDKDNTKKENIPDEHRCKSPQQNFSKQNSAIHQKAHKLWSSWFIPGMQGFFNIWKSINVQFSSVTQSCLTLCDPMNCSTPGLPVHHQLLEFTQTHIHRVNDAIQPSHPLASPSPPAPNPSQHQSLFQWVNSSHEVVKVLEFQL